MSSSLNDTTPGPSQGGASDISRDSLIRFQGPNESSSSSSRPTSNQGNTARASTMLPEDVMARINRIEDEIDRNQQTKAAREQLTLVKYIDKDGRDRSYYAEDYEANKRRSPAELEKHVADTLARIETKLAEQTKMKKAMREVFTLMGGDQCDGGSGKGRRGKH
ncbi:g6980 [Coccomyxa elongata]